MRGTEADRRLHILQGTTPVAIHSGRKRGEGRRSTRAAQTVCDQFDVMSVRYRQMMPRCNKFTFSARFFGQVATNRAGFRIRALPVRLVFEEKN